MKTMKQTIKTNASFQSSGTVEAMTITADRVADSLAMIERCFADLGECFEGTICPNAGGAVSDFR